MPNYVEILNRMELRLKRIEDKLEQLPVMFGEIEDKLAEYREEFDDRLDRMERELYSDRGDY